MKVGIGLLCSLGLGFAGALVIGKLIIALAGRASPTRARKRFDYLQIAAAAFMAFNHGLNDGQKFMGVFALTMMAGGAMQVFEIPLWIVIICALTMGTRNKLWWMADHSDDRHETDASHGMARLCRAVFRFIHDLWRIASSASRSAPRIR